MRSLALRKVAIPSGRHDFSKINGLARKCPRTLGINNQGVSWNKSNFLNHIHANVNTAYSDESRGTIDFELLPKKLRQVSEIWCRFAETDISREVQEHVSQVAGYYLALWKDGTPQNLKSCAEIEFKSVKVLKKLAANSPRLMHLNSTVATQCLFSMVAGNKANEFERKSGLRHRLELSETSNSRPPPLYNKDHAFLCSYGSATALPKKTFSKPIADFPSNQTKSANKKTKTLKVGVQSKLIDAARKSFDIGFPLNTLVTVRSKLFSEAAGDSFELVPPHEWVKQFALKLRKWLTRANRKLPVAYIWVRENAGHEGEHFHLALHLPKKYLVAFLEFVERTLVEPQAPEIRPAQIRTRGEIACSQEENWHVAIEEPDGKPQFPGYWLAAYTGKGEPSERLFRGIFIDNSVKEVRGKQFGGWLKHNRYDAPQGLIEGSQHRNGRYAISRLLMPNKHREAV